MQKIWKTAAAAMLASCAVIAPAEARDFDRVVAFGDSYADIGNVAALAPGLFNFTVYPTGRFSGGTNFVETLAG